MFVMWEFHPCRHAAYLSDIGYFNWDLGVGLDDDEEDKNDNNDDVEGRETSCSTTAGRLIHLLSTRRSS
jgi:hypothetical protein